MRKGTGKIIICIVLSALLILGGSYLLKLAREVNGRMARLKRGQAVEAVLSELPSGNYSSDTAEFMWKYTYTDKDGNRVSDTTAGRYTKQELSEIGYRMTVYVSGKDSMEEAYLFGGNEESYATVILFYCLAALPLLFIGWIFLQRALYNRVLQYGTVYYAEFLGAYREGSYYKIKFCFEADGKKIIKTTKPAYSYGAVEVFKTNGVIEIKYYKNRAAISQRILGIKMQ